MTSFRILGPIEAVEGGVRVEVGGRRQLALLAFLLLHANRPVSSDAIRHAIWGPARDGADNRLQMAIARLRRALAPPDPVDRPRSETTGAPRLQTIAGGYMLAVRPGELDSEVFGAAVHGGRNALDAGDAARAAEVLHDALSLWRGPPLAEVAFEEFTQAEVRRLEELHLAAVEARVDADLQLGRHARLVGELEARLTSEPTREGLAAQLMIALYRCGRQADALAVYQRTRAGLADELGLEPGPALRALQVDILNQAPSLDAAAPTDRRAPAPTAGHALASTERGAPAPPPGHTAASTDRHASPRTDRLGPAPTTSQYPNPTDRHADPSTVDRARSGWASRLPTGVVTFCLSDIDESSRFWEAPPDELAEWLDHHHELVARAVEAHGGRFLNSIGEGDSTISVFESATQAVRAAIAATCALQGENVPAMPARFGLHTGQAQLRGAVYLGTTITLAARVREQAAGGEILLSEATASLVRRDLPRGYAIVDLGPRRLEGIERPEAIKALTGPSLATAPIAGE